MLIEAFNSWFSKTFCFQTEAQKMEENNKRIVSETFLVKNHYSAIFLSQLFGYFPISVTFSRRKNHSNLNSEISVAFIFSFIILLAHILWIICWTYSSSKIYNSEGITSYILIAWGFIMVPLVIIVRVQKFRKNTKFLLLWKNLVNFNTKLCQVLSEQALSTYISNMGRKNRSDFYRAVYMTIIVIIHFLMNGIVLFAKYFEFPFSLKFLSWMWDLIIIVYAINSCVKISITKTFVVAFNALSAELVACNKYSHCPQFLFAKKQHIADDRNLKLKTIISLFKELETLIKKLCIVHSWEILIDVVFATTQILLSIFMIMTTDISAILLQFMATCILAIYCETLWQLCSQGSKITDSAHEFIDELENVSPILMDEETKYLVSHNVDHNFL